MGIEERSAPDLQEVTVEGAGLLVCMAEGGEVKGGEAFDGEEARGADAADLARVAAAQAGNRKRRPVADGVQKDPFSGAQLQPTGGQLG